MAWNRAGLDGARTVAGMATAQPSARGRRHPSHRQSCLSRWQPAAGAPRGCGALWPDHAEAGSKPTRYEPRSARLARRPRLSGSSPASQADRLMSRLLPPFPVLVVFVNHAECRWLRVLRTGFRHCFVVMRDGSVWLACDPLKDRIELSVVPVPESFDLAGFYAARWTQRPVRRDQAGPSSSRLWHHPSDLRHDRQASAWREGPMRHDALAALPAT